MHGDVHGAASRDGDGMGEPDVEKGSILFY
jgi:hypothetical protein